MKFEDLREEAAELIVDEVAIGSYNAAEINDIALDFLQDEGLVIKQEITDRVSDMVNTALDFHYLKQQDWNDEETDAEKLEEAFMELWERGIIAAMNFTCCQTCGHSEMALWLEQADNQDKRGYVFFHEQDARSMIKNNYLYLAFGSRSCKEEDSLQIAREIAIVLEKHGLEITWNGTTRTRINIPKIIWRLRRVKALDYAAD